MTEIKSHYVRLYMFIVTGGSDDNTEQLKVNIDRCFAMTA